MSRAPLVMAKPDAAFPRGDATLYDTTLGWRFVNPPIEERYSTDSMGVTGRERRRALTSRARTRTSSRSSQQPPGGDRRRGPLRRGDRAGGGRAAGEL